MTISSKRIFPIKNILIILITGLFLSNCNSRQNIPSARYGSKMIFDPVSKRVIMFGGRAEGIFGLKYFNDLWAFDYQTLTWTPIKATNQPDGRLSPGMVYDPDHHQIILFGGHDTQDRIDDTWVFDLEENEWTEVAPAISPSPRSDMDITYDHENKVVILFGGYCQEYTRELCDDTWVFDPTTTTWTEMQPNLSPPISYGHTMVYDPVNHWHLLWGGHMSEFRDGSVASLGYRSKLWGYDVLKNSWQPVEVIQSNILTARYWHQSTFDMVNGKMFVFGGNGGHGFLSDTWKFNLVDRTWENVSTLESPSPRINPAIAYDSENDVIVIFGGMGEDHAIFRDTWVYRDTKNLSEWIDISNAVK